MLVLQHSQHIKWRRLCPYALPYGQAVMQAVLKLMTSSGTAICLSCNHAGYLYLSFLSHSPCIHLSVTKPRYVESWLDTGVQSDVWGRQPVECPGCLLADHLLCCWNIISLTTLTSSADSFDCWDCSLWQRCQTYRNFIQWLFSRVDWHIIECLSIDVAFH